MLRPFAAPSAVAALLLAGACAVAADPPTKSEKPAEKPTAASTIAAVNAYIAEGYSKADIKKAADKAPELEFLRRVFIDLLGRIATPDEVLDFEQDRSPDKKAKLVRRLLNATDYVPKIGGQPVKAEDGKKNLVFNYAEEFANHWANQWTVWLLSRTAHPTYREQMQAWLAEEFVKDTPYSDIARQLLTATGAGNKNGAINFIAVHLGDPVPAGERTALGNHDAVPITSRVTRLFLGIQTQCNQCHDHPFSKGLEQPDFWGVNAFFRQTTRNATPTPAPPPDQRPNAKMANVVQLTLSDDTALNGEAKIFYERRNGTQGGVKPVFLKSYANIETENTASKGAKMGGSKTRREQLADAVIGHDNFARAYVNRVWGHLFGRGLQKDPTVDDFGSHNEIVHRDLMDRLATDFTAYNYSTKMLLEWVCCSDVYALSHVANKDYADPKYDAYFARMPLKAMSPETLFDALAHATRSESVTSKDSARRNALRNEWLGKLVRNFGDDEGNELTFNGTIVQALMMMNGKQINDEVKRKDDGIVALAMKKHGKKQGEAFFNAVTDELFLTALNRHASRTELTALLDIMKKGGMLKTDKPADPKGPSTGGTQPMPKGPNPKGPNPKGPNPKGPNPKDPPSTGPVVTGGSNLFDATFYQDVFWALLNTNEFMLNH